ncbi:MAG: gliding motility-associated C-terminal domain-containing protein, partial [Candidatus Saccharibacteria bacterium]
EDALGGTAIASPTLDHLGTKTYYAEASNGICSSPIRTPVVLAIAPEINTPTVVALSTNDNTPKISGTATVNVGDPFKVTVNGITYTLGDGNLSIIGNVWSLQIPAGSEIADGTYSVTAIVTDAFGNSSTDVTNNELVIDTTAPSVPTVDMLRTNDNTPLITGTAIVEPTDVFKVTVNGVTYTLGDGNLSIIGNVWSLQIPAENKLSDGTYSVTAIVTDAFGNSSQDQSQNEITVQKIHGPVARIAGAPSIMLGNCSSGLLLDGSTSSGENLQYSWTPSRHLDNPLGSKPEFHPGLTTRYLLTVTDNKGQTDTTSILVMVADAPKAITDKDVFVEAPEDNIVLNASRSTGTGISYQWLTKQGHILAGENLPNVTVNGLGTYYLLVKDSFGCTSRDSVNVGLYIQAVNDTANVTVNGIVAINVLRNDLPHGGLNPSSISIVTPPSHGVASLAADSLINYRPETSYSGQDEFIYAVCNNDGLCDNARVLVLVTDLPFFIPEAFSPNGDGKNDKFIIKGLEKYSRVEIEIFNRWGNVVYRSHNYGEGEGKDGFWDGLASTGLRIASGPVPSGTYYYILKMNGQKNISGALYLDR